MVGAGELSFPLTQLPLQMATNENFWKTRALWAGTALAGSIRILNGVHDIFPFVPGFPASIRVDDHFTERPWNAIGYTSLSFNTAIVGLSYFMPLDLAFSCWFFFWLTRAERVLASAMGWQNLHLNDRAAGAWIGISFIALWSARRHLAEVARHIVGKARRLDKNEPLSYRTAAALTLGCLAVVFLFCAAAGMSLWALAVWYALFFAFALALGACARRLGTAVHEVIGMSPRQIMTDLFGLAPAGRTEPDSALHAVRLQPMQPLASDAESGRVAAHRRTRRHPRASAGLDDVRRYRRWSHRPRLRPIYSLRISTARWRKAADISGGLDGRYITRCSG